MSDNKIALSSQNKDDFANSYLSIFKNEIKSLRELIDIVKDSHYNQAFLEESTEIDDEGKKKSVLVVNTNAMLSTAITGRMIGLDPLSALALGKSLDQHAISKVQQGKRLGLDVYQSLRLIHIFTNPKDGKVSQTVSANLIEGILLKNNIIIEVLRDCDPEYKYIQVSNKVELNNKDILENGKLIDKYILYVDGLHNQAFINEQTAKGKIFVIKILVDLVTEVKMTRIFKDRTDVKTYSVTRQDVINWGFLKGTTIFGTVIDKSRSIWETRYPQMTLKTAISNCGRRIANDLIEGLYSHEEMGYIVDEDGNKIDDESNIQETIIDTVAEDVTKETKQ